MNEQEVQRLLVRLTGDASGYQKMTQDVGRSTGAVTGRLAVMSQRVNVMGHQLRGYGTAFAAIGAGIVGVGSAMGTAQRGIALAADSEENEVAFGVMLGNMEKGKKLVKDLQDFAAKTPMDTATLQQSAKLLLQFGVAGDNLLPIMQMLGNATGGNAEKMRAMSLAFGQMSSTGRLMGGDLFQMVNAGFNPLQEMAEHLAKTIGGDVNMHMQTLKKRMEAGQISIRQVIESFQRASAAGGRFEGLMEKQSQTLKGLFSTMQDDVDGVLREIGKSLAEGLDLKGMMKDVSAVAQATREWFIGLSAGTKQAIFSFVALLAAVVALTVGFFVLKAVVTAAFGGLNLVAAAFITTLMAAVAGGTALVSSIGGLVGLWSLIKQKAAEAWEWLQPIRERLVSLFHTAKQVAIDAWDWIKRTAADLWFKVFGDAQINWDKIRGTIEDAILYAEFALLEFEMVSRTAWAGIKYYAVAALNAILKNIFLVLGGPLVLGALAVFGVNWQKTFSEIFSFTGRVFVKLAANLARFFAMLHTALAGGSVDWSGFWVDFNDEFKVGLRGIQSGTLQALEDSLRREFDALKDATGESLDDFMKRRKAGFVGPMLPDNVVEAAEKQLGDLGEQAMLAKAAVKSLDAALYGSAEAKSRIAEFRNLITMTPGNNNATAGPSEVAARGTAEANAREEKNTGFLKQIAEATTIMSRKDQPALAGANF